MKQCGIMLWLLIMFTTCFGQGPNDIIHSAIRDHSGNLWFCTSNGKGITRYDGTTFTTISEAEGLCNNHVTAILEDQDRILWLATDQGICRYDGTNFTPFRIPGDTVIAIGNTTENAKWMHIAPTIHSLMQDKAGNIWFGTEFGAYRYNPRLSDPAAIQESKIDHPAFTHFLPQEVVSCMFQDKAGTIWLGSWSQGGLYRYDQNQTEATLSNQGHQHSPKKQDLPTNSQATPSRFIRQNGPSDGMIACIYQDQHGILWIGTRDHGICRYNPAKDKRKQATHPTSKAWTNIAPQKGFSIDNASCIIEDAAGNLWFGSSTKSGTKPGGISRYDGKTFTPFSPGQGLENNDIFCSVQDNAGNLWFGGRYGRLFKYDGKQFTDHSAEIP